MKFHTYEGGGIKFHDDNTRLVGSEGYLRSPPSYHVVFSSQPVRPERTVKLTVLKTARYKSSRCVDIGLTQIDPSGWDGKKALRETDDTCSICTGSGSACRNYRKPVNCERWIDVFGIDGSDYPHQLSKRDVIGLTLHKNHTMSLSINDKQVTDIFTDLPEGDYWMVARISIEEVSISSSGFIRSKTSFSANMDIKDPMNQLSLGQSQTGSDYSIHKTAQRTKSGAAKVKSPTSCDYWTSCQRYMDSLGVADLYMNKKLDTCYCKSCIRSREDDLYYDRGVPPRQYAIPVGWSRFGLKTPHRADKLDVFSLWHVAFHGTSAGTIESILDTGDLLKPGEHTLDGIQLKPPAGHFNEESKPDGFDIKQVFVSPSIRYAGLPVYSKRQSWRDPVTRQRYQASVALQLRIKPESYQVGPETVLPPGLKHCISIDDGMDNSELEWSTKNRGATIPVGVLVLLLPQ